MSSGAVTFKKQSLEALVLYLESDGSVVYLTLWAEALTPEEQLPDFYGPWSWKREVSGS